MSVHQGSSEENVPGRGSSILVSDRPGEESGKDASQRMSRGGRVSAPESGDESLRASRVKRMLRWVLAVLAGVSLPGSVFLLGWVSSGMRHAQGRLWSRQSGPGAWVRLTREHPEWRALEKGAGWFADPSSERGWWSRKLGRLRSHFTQGIAMLSCSWILTLPGLVLMYFSWYAGWQNSFNKGYEDAWVGPATGLGGIALWIVAMMYVPMAQARLASTGEWKRFFEFRLVMQIIRRAWLGNVVLVTGYAVLALPWIVAWLIPGFLPQMNPELAQATPETVTKILGRIHLGAAVVLVPALVALRWFAARLYAMALLDGVQKGAIGEGQLSSLEWRTFHTLELLRPVVPRALPSWQRVLLNLGTGVGRAMAAGATVLLWFMVIGQVYIAQFFAYRGGWGWLNHPLIQLPWM